MTRRESLYKRHRFPGEIIQHAVWPYYRFNLSHRDIEDILARRGILVTRESIRLWCNKFGPGYAHRLRRGHRGYGDTVFMDEVFVWIRGQYRYLWEVTRSPAASRCRALGTIPVDTRTTGPSCRTSRPAFGSGG